MTQTGSPRQQPRVAIVGGGFGGLAVAIKLAQAGHREMTVYERAHTIGGTWQANTYPRIACDAPSHIYSFSYAPNPGWSHRFAPGAEIQAYLERCVDEAGIRHQVRTGCTVRSATWNGACWRLLLDDGSETEADVLVPACGPLSVPKLPAIPGLETFAGEQWHTAQWRHDVDLSGLRVGVVGTGASAVQVVPWIADRATRLTVFQRTAPYVFAKPDVEYQGHLKAFYAKFPAAQRFSRGGIKWHFELINLAFWLQPSAARILEVMHRKYLESVVSDPDLRKTLTPGYRAGCKRPAMDSEYYPALALPHVDVETSGIARVEPAGVQLADGGFVGLDVLVFATGFDTNGFATSMEIRGRDDVELQEAWHDGARAFLGLSVPRFPNMFLIYGPNTNLGAGSILMMIEAQAAHVAAAVRILAESPEPLEVRPDAFEKEDRRLTRMLPRTIWSTGCGNWYRDRTGRDTHNWPGSMAGYRRRTAQVRASEYRRLPVTVHTSADA